MAVFRTSKSIIWLLVGLVVVYVILTVLGYYNFQNPSFTSGIEAISEVR